MLLSGTAIWATLGTLGVMATFMVVERILFLLEHSEADPIALRDWLRRCKRGIIKCSQYQSKELGWLGPCLKTAGNNRLKLHRLSTGFRQDTERFGPVLATVPNLAQMLGLLGTAAGIGMCKVGVSDPYALMGLAIETTKCGLAIAIPTLFAASLLNKRTSGLHEQVERVLERLDQSGGPYRKRPRVGRQAGKAERQAPPVTCGHAEAEAAADVKRNLPRNDNRARQKGNGQMPVDSQPRAKDASPPEAVEPAGNRDAVEEAAVASAEEKRDVRPASLDPIFEEIFLRDGNREEVETDEVGASLHKGNGHYAGGEDRCTPY
ncbi:MAG: MotA/TolQ/ExbB proton channel family protein [Planctomycetota bacterium]